MKSLGKICQNYDDFEYICRKMFEEFILCPVCGHDHCASEFDNKWSTADRKKLYEKLIKGD